MTEMFAQAYMLGCLAAAVFHIFQVCKCFSAAECLHVTGLEGSQTWTKPHPDNRAGATTGTTSSPSCLGLLVSGIHVLGCSSAI